MCQVSPKPDSLVNALLEDLEQQALGLHLLARDQELAEREQAEYAQVSLRGRWHGAVGAQVQVGLSTGQRLRGTVQRSGADWVLLADALGAELLVPHHGVLTVAGLPNRAIADEALGVLQKLSWRSIVRGLISQHATCSVTVLDQSLHVGRFTKAGADFVEFAAQGSDVVVMPWRAVALVRVTSA